MSDTFKITCTGHEAGARKIALEKRLTTTEKLAAMCRYEVEEIINDSFVIFQVGEDWLLIPKNKAEEILKQVLWIER